MAEDESIERIAERVRSLGRDGVAEVGQLPLPVFRYWEGIRNGRMVITGERLGHLYVRHPETKHLLLSVIETVLDPDEIHRNKNDLEMAIFWRSLGGEGRHFMRAAVWLPIQSDLAASVLSARKTRRDDCAREVRQGRTVWKRET